MHFGDILRPENVSGGNVFCSFSGDKIVLIGVNPYRHAEFVLINFNSPFRGLDPINTAL